MVDTYPIDTLLQMAAIPEEAQGRFLDELPDILASIRSLIGSFPAADLNLTFEGATWSDDGERHGTVRLHQDGEVIAQVRIPTKQDA